MPMLTFWDVPLIHTLFKVIHYYGVLIGQLSEGGHGVKGRVYAVNPTTFRVRHFYYDGAAPGMDD